MCGIAGIFGKNWKTKQLIAMQSVQNHRGPDDEGMYIDSGHVAGLAHNRLSIIDLSKAGRQPMNLGDNWIVFNGEIYNYLELRRELESDFDFKTKTDTEVLLAAYEKWGTAFLDKLIGMFAFVIWNEKKKTAFAARDRFGVKPLYFHGKKDGTFFLASEIKAIHAAGIEREPNPQSWANYLSYGLTDYAHETFWKGISSLPAGFILEWRDGEMKFSRWYDIVDKVHFEFDRRNEAEVRDEYLELMKESVKLRFRSDVPVGINLSGGLDSSSLLSVVQQTQNGNEEVKAFTFTTGDDRYDELPWVREMLKQTKHPLIVCELSPLEVPEMAASVQKIQDEPFGGLPTLAYAKLFATARQNGVKVLLDGNGMDEQWGGYDYYQTAFEVNNGQQTSVVQGTKEKPLKPECLVNEFRRTADFSGFPQVFPDKFRNLQYRDTVFTKIPRSMRYNDRISMRASTELREPFLDHRLFELAFRQSPERKRNNGTSKKMLREITKTLLPSNVSEAPKRPLQTPQREWLRGSLREWADNCIKTGLNSFGGAWMDEKSVLKSWEDYCAGESDNSFYIWQWISLGLIQKN